MKWLCWYQRQSFSFVNLHPQGEERSAASPGDWPETQLASWSDCISIEQTTSYQTSQWRERSRRKGKWKIMNTSQVTVAQRQFTADVFRKSLRKGRIDWASAAEEPPVFDLKDRKKATAGQELPFQFVETEISLHRRASLIWTHTHTYTDNTHKHKYPFFFNWVINAAVVFANETRAEPPTNRSCRCQPAQWALWVGWLKQARLMNGTDQLLASGRERHHPWSRMLR